jgi:quercetin dioxygenase-like cupin family protein
MPATYSALDRFDHESFPALDILGPILRFVVPDEARGKAFSIIEGTLKPGMFVPLHSHQDRESFLVLSGSLEVWNGSAWIGLSAGDIFDASGNLPHAWRNTSDGPARILIVTTPSLAAFLRDNATSIETLQPGPPSADRLQRFVESAIHHGHWFASPGENRAIGLPTG